jgi:hypothetical protein
LRLDTPFANAILIRIATKGGEVPMPAVAAGVGLGEHLLPCQFGVERPYHRIGRSVAPIHHEATHPAVRDAYTR